MLPVVGSSSLDKKGRKGGVDAVALLSWDGAGEDPRPLGIGEEVESCELFTTIIGDCGQSYP
jgi:hypothetical protein